MRGLIVIEIIYYSTLFANSFEKGLIFEYLAQNHHTRYIGRILYKYRYCCTDMAEKSHFGFVAVISTEKYKTCSKSNVLK